jgi:hypothetical protein
MLDTTEAERRIKASKKSHYETHRDVIRARNKAAWEHCRALLNAAKEVPCMDCGVEYPPYIMDFDHRDPSQKTGEVTRLVTHGEKRVLEEIAKCDIVCANCHRERTHSRL